MSSNNSNPSSGSSPHTGPHQGDEVDEDCVQIDMAEIAKKLNLPEKTVAMKIRAAASNDHEEHGATGTPQSTSYNIRKGTLRSRPSASSSAVSPAMLPPSTSTASVPIQLDPQPAASASPSYVGSLKNTVDNLGSQSPHRKHFVLLKRPSMLGDDLGDGGGKEGKKASSLSADGAGFGSGGKSESSLSAAGRGGGYLAVRKGSNLDPAANVRLDHTSAPDGDISEAYLLAAPQAQSPQQNSSGFISLRRGDKKGSVIMSVHNSHLSNNDDGINGGDDYNEDAKSDHSSRSGGNVVVPRDAAPVGTESEHLLGSSNTNKSNSSMSLPGATSGANTGPEGSINDDSDTHRKSRKQVHFPEDVVSQITIIHRENSLVMQVEYNRPLIAYVGCLLSVLLLVVAWCQISKAAFYTDVMTGGLHDGVVSRSVALISSFAFLSTSVVLVGWCIATGVPSFDERASLQHFHHRRKLAICSITGSAGLVLMASAFMLHVSSINFVVYSMWPLIFSYLWHIYKTREISRIDAVGLILAITGTGIMIVGEVNRPDYQSTSRRWVSVTLSFIAAIAETLRWNHEKQSRRYFSNALVMVCTTGIAGVVLLIIALVLKAFTEPIGRGAELLSELDRSNAGLIIGACIAMFAATTTSHAAAVYFDTLTMISIVAMSGPLCVLAFGWFGLPTMELIYRGVGGCAMAFGSFLLIFTGFVFRRHVELVFALPGEEEVETPITSLRED